ncbi:hypothetical protein ACHWQZ_G016780 [Mnemiopsis leidyi]
MDLLGYYNEWDFFGIQMLCSYELCKQACVNTTVKHKHTDKHADKHTDTEQTRTSLWSSFRKRVKTRQYSYVVPEENSQEGCAICLKKFGKKKILRELACKHVFHKTCVDVWLLNKTSCPLCRASTCPNSRE